MTDTPAPAQVYGRIGQAYQAARLRWAGARDAERLEALCRQAYPDAPPSWCCMDAWLEHGGALVLEDDGGEMLAALRWRESARGWEVDRVATLPRHRGQGYGRWLMTKLEAAAIRANVPVLSLRLPLDAREEQLTYYARMGYLEKERSEEHVQLEKRVGGTWQTKSPGSVDWTGAAA